MKMSAFYLPETFLNLPNDKVTFSATFLSTSCSNFSSLVFLSNAVIIFHISFVKFFLIDYI